MNFQNHRSRSHLLVRLALTFSLFLSCEPGYVGINVSNRTSEDLTLSIRLKHRAVEGVRIARSHSQDILVDAFPYNSPCSPPDRWIPDYFDGLTVRHSDGRVEIVTRDDFLSHATYRSHWYYTIGR